MPIRSLPQPFGRVYVPRGVLPHRVDVMRNAITYGDANEPIPTPVVMKRQMSCWVQNTPTEETIAGRVVLVYTHTVIFFDNPEVQDGDFLMFGKRQLNVVSDNDALEIGYVWSVQAKELT